MRIKRKGLYIVIVLLILLLNTILLYMNYENIIYYDSSTEMQYAHLLRESNSFLSQDWGYSTELRFFYIEWIFTPLFYIFNSWKTVRVLGTLILNILLVISFLYCLNSIKKTQKNILYSALVVLPISWVYYWYTTVNAFYIPHIFAIFITIGGVLRFHSTKKKTHLIFPFILALLTGLNGIRELLILYIPLVLAVLWICLGRVIKDDSENFLSSIKKHLLAGGFVAVPIILAAVNLMGYIINSKVISRFFTFSSYADYSLANLSADRIINVINSFLGNFGYGDGYSSGINVFSFAGIAAIFSLILMAVTITIVCRLLNNSSTVAADSEKNVQENRTLVIWLGIFSLAFHTFVLIFCDAPNEPRYFIPILSIAFVIWIIYIQERPANDAFKKIVLIITAVGVLLGCCATTVKLIRLDNVGVDRREVIDWVDNNNYVMGYSDFYTGGVIPELSKNHIPMYYIEDWKSLTASNWLMEKGLTEKKTEGKVFVLFTIDQYNKAKEYSYANNGIVVLKNESYYVLEYINNNHIWSALK